MLADLQREFSRAILSGEKANIAFAPGRVSAAAALQVYRNTVIGTLVNALRLTFPSVDRLVGEDFFDQAAAAFAENHPPTVARLSAYGDGFPAFLEQYAPATGLGYLGDVARLDLAIDRALLQSQARSRFILDDGVALDTPSALCLLALNYPADAIKNALEADDEAALAAIDLSPRPHWLALWRRGSHVAIRGLRAPAAKFLLALQAGASADEAFIAACAEASPEAVLPVIQADIFSASFARVIFKDERP